MKFKLNDHVKQKISGRLGTVIGTHAVDDLREKASAEQQLIIKNVKCEQIVIVRMDNDKLLITTNEDLSPVIDLSQRIDNQQIWENLNRLEKEKK